MQLSPEAKGCGEDLVSVILLLLALLSPCWLCCQTVFPLMVVTWLHSLQPYVFPKFKLAYVFMHRLHKGLEEHRLDGSGHMSSPEPIAGNDVMIG